jgi:hypothetical protein
MTNLRFNRDTKVFASSRNEIVKRDRKFRAQKINKDKVFVSRDSSMLKKLRAFAFESEYQRQSKSQFESKSQRFVIDSFIVVSIVFALIDNATLFKMLFQLCHFRLMRIFLWSFRLRFSSFLLLFRLRFLRWSRSLTIRTWTTSTLC